MLWEREEQDIVKVSFTAKIFNSMLKISDYHYTYLNNFANSECLSKCSTYGNFWTWSLSRERGKGLEPL